MGNTQEAIKEYEDKASNVHRISILKIVTKYPNNDEPLPLL